MLTYLLSSHDIPNISHVIKLYTALSLARELR